MNYEDKYKEALERAKKLHDSYNLMHISVDEIEQIFPELAESEDERIRKWLLGEMKIHYDFESPNLNPMVEKALAWLEKQKEQKPEIRVKIPKFRVGDIIQHIPLEKWDRTKKIVSIDECGYNYDVSHLGDTVSGGAIGFAFENEYELVEQKPAEWSEEEYGRLFDIEHYLHGTLQLSPDRRIACINFLKALKNRGNSLKSNTNSPKWSEEDEEMIQDIIASIDTNISASDFHEMEDWLKSLPERFNLQPKQEWSEEDEACIRNLESIIYYDKKLPNDTRVILGKFLSNLRPQPQGTYKQVIHTIFGMLKDKDFYEIQPSHRVSLLNDIRVKCKDAIECAPILDEPSWKPGEVCYGPKGDPDPAGVWKPSDEDLMMLEHIIGQYETGNKNSKVMGYLPRVEELDFLKKVLAKWKNLL